MTPILKEKRKEECQRKNATCRLQIDKRNTGNTRSSTAVEQSKSSNALGG